MTARLLGPAQLDVIDLADWYEQQSAGLGARFFEAVDGLLATLAQLPQLYARVAGCPRGREVREALVTGFPVIAAYEVTPTEVLVVSVVHARSARNPWKRRLL